MINNSNGNYINNNDKFVRTYQYSGAQGQCREAGGYFQACQSAEQAIKNKTVTIPFLSVQ